MAINITIDQGNTSTKLCLWVQHRICFQTSGAALSPGLPGSLAGEYGAIDTAIVSSVAHLDEAFVKALQEVCRRVVVLNHDTPMPLTIDYRTPSTLGRDRIAAMVGAMTVAPDCPLLVVDAGTAVTYDAVSAEGHFIGGNIAPGIHMRLEALHRFTARLPMVSVDGPVPMLGYDTDTALRSGAIGGVVAETLQVLRSLPEGTRIVLTGGDATLLESHLPVAGANAITVCPDLVHIGLNRIIEELTDSTI